MLKIKFLLFGISGNLAKIKILPSLAQFAALHENDLEISLIGYSRSSVDEKQIANILDQNSSDGKHKLAKIELLQGDYEDSHFYNEIIQSLQENEKLWVYLAVPPSVFIPFLQNSCPYHSEPIDIMVEKPFGQTAQEGQKLLQVVEACSLGERVHFCDHYLFKGASFLEEIQEDLLKNFAKTSELESMEVQILENVGLQTRGGYYESIGAFKDMWVHLFSLTGLGLNLLDQEEFLQARGWQTESLLLGQYENYLQDLQINSSATETYFQLQAKLLLDSKTVDLVWESGKKLREKKTEIRLNFQENKQIIWQLYPKAQIQLVENGEIQTLEIKNNQKMDQTNLFETLLQAPDSPRFISNSELTESWEIYEQVSNFRHQQKASFQIYQDSTYPIKMLP